jgi:hypothetical protein
MPEKNITSHTHMRSGTLVTYVFKNYKVVRIVLFQLVEVLAANFQPSLLQTGRI